MFHQMTSGWKYFMVNLKFYVEKHFDVRRDMVWTRRRTTMSPHDVWQRVLGPDGFGIGADADKLSINEGYSSSVLAEPIAGRVRMSVPHVHFTGTVESLDGLLFIELEPGKDSRHVGIWLSTYGMPPTRVAALQESMNGVADRIFGPNTQ